MEFFVGGITKTEDGRPLPYPDSLDKTTTNPSLIILSIDWREYTIDLTSKNLSHVIGGFGFSTNDTYSTFYLDDIRFDSNSGPDPDPDPNPDPYPAPDPNPDNGGDDTDGSSCFINTVSVELPMLSSD